MNVVKGYAEKSHEQGRTENFERPRGAADRDWVRLILNRHSVQVRREVEVRNFCRGRVRFAFADDHIFFDEERNVSTAGDDDADSLIDSFSGKVIVKPLPQETCIVANDIIFAGVISLGAPKYVFADLLLGELVGLLEQMLLAYIDDEAGEEPGLRKSSACGKTPGELPSRIVLEPQSIFCSNLP
jgi:hypothetical protein